uniref:Uncharacterized protein n=1 Tax=Timema bartmani TaxID=61472 RepID=A0A7R9EUW4_9NEOP|nr:unnamed protein product [Timema bartmani]
MPVINIAKWRSTKGRSVASSTSPSSLHETRLLTLPFSQEPLTDFLLFLENASECTGCTEKRRALSSAARGLWPPNRRSYTNNDSTDTRHIKQEFCRRPTIPEGEHSEWPVRLVAVVVSETCSPKIIVKQVPEGPVWPQILVVHNSLRVVKHKVAIYRMEGIPRSSIPDKLGPSWSWDALGCPGIRSRPSPAISTVSVSVSAPLTQLIGGQRARMWNGSARLTRVRARKRLGGQTGERAHKEQTNIREITAYGHTFDITDENILFDSTTCHYVSRHRDRTCHYVSVIETGHIRSLLVNNYRELSVNYALARTLASLATQSLARSLARTLASLAEPLVRGGRKNFCRPLSACHGRSEVRQGPHVVQWVGQVPRCAHTDHDLRIDQLLRELLDHNIIIFLPSFLLHPQDRLHG